MRTRPDFSCERAALATLNPRALVCGVDEAGRGPWAGPVTAAAVILDPRAIPPGIDDSKALSAAARDALARTIKHSALAWSVAEATSAEIDQLNILRATHLAMRRAVERLSRAPSYALVDGNRLPPDLPCPASALVKGDARSLSIAAASILAKTARDAVMAAADLDYPGYGFARHKGYGVPQHSEALARLGPCPLHRLSFKPVRAAMDLTRHQTG